MWFKEHIRTAVMIGILLIFGVLVAMSFRGEESSGIKGKTQNLVAQIEEPLSDAVSGLKSGFSGIFGFKKLGKEKKELIAEKKALEQENLNLKLSKQEYEQLKKLSNIFKYETIQHENFLAANVVSVDHSNWMQIFTIDQGQAGGIKKGAVILDGDGLVGRVAEVSRNTAKVVSVLDEQSKISFQLEKDEKMMGVVQGDGKSGISGYLLDGEANVKEGDTLVTSGIGHYPKGLKIGKIIKVEKNKGTQFIQIQIEPSVTFKRLQKVAVIL